MNDRQVAALIQTEMHSLHGGGGAGGDDGGGAHEVHHVLHKKKRRKQLVAVVQPGEPVAVLANGLHHHPAAGFEGSYVAVSGTPGRGSVHVVDSGRGLSITFTKPWRSNV